MNISTDTPQLKELTLESLGRASESFGFMIRHKVQLQEIFIEEIKSADSVTQYFAEDMFMLTTEIIGDMKGKSYLFFRKEEADRVFELCTGMQVGSSSLGVDAVLKEIDNIVSASMISVLADKLKVCIYGDVPYCFDYSKDEILTVMKKDLHQFSGDHDQYLIRCMIKSEDANLTVDFYWILSGDIIARIAESS